MYLSKICLTAIVIDPVAMTTRQYSELHEAECQTERCDSWGDTFPYELDPHTLYVCWEHGLIAHYKSKKSAQQLKPYEIEALYLKAKLCKPVNIDNAKVRSW